MGDRPIGSTIKERLRSSGGRLSGFHASGRRLIAAAAIFHVALTAGLFWAGRAQVAPRLIDRDGIMESFAFDSYEYRREAARLAGILKEGGVRAWAAEPERAHVKLISIQFALLGPLFGHSTLSAEPLNLFCYVAILSLVLLLGREVGGGRVGLLTAGTVALWPTFLLHTTQLLKDPLFIAGALALILIVTTWLTRTYDWRGAVGMGALTAVATGLLLLVRAQFGVVILAVVFFAFALLTARQLLERRLLFWNLICPLLILIAGTLAAFYPPHATRKIKQYPSGGGGQHKSVVGPWKQLHGVVSYPSAGPLRTKLPPTHRRRLSAAPEAVALEVSRARNKFNFSYPESGSSIDRHVEYRNAKDLIHYLPRAFAIGFWAPFPETWLSAGRRVGSAGRLLSGAETLLIYLFQLLALLALWRAPRCLAAWLLFLITIFGVTGLGLVVSNVGALYRFRYLFWMLLIILGVKGLEGIVRGLKTRGLNSRLRTGVAAACLLVAACSCTSRAGSEAGEANRAAPAVGSTADGAAPAGAFAGALDFTLVNFTGTTLHAVYVSPAESEGWEENVLGRDELFDGDTVEIKFSPEEKAVSWDLRAEDNYGNSAEWKGLNLREISRITLRLGKDEDVIVAEAE